MGPMVQRFFRLPLISLFYSEVCKRPCTLRVCSVHFAACTSGKFSRRGTSASPAPGPGHRHQPNRARLQAGATDALVVELGVPLLSGAGSILGGGYFKVALSIFAAQCALRTAHSNRRVQDSAAISSGGVPAARPEAGTHRGYSCPQRVP